MSIGLDRMLSISQIGDFHHENTDYLITLVIILQTVLLVVLIHKQTPVFPVKALIIVSDKKLQV